MKSFFYSLYAIAKPSSKLKATPTAVDLGMDLLLSTQARKHGWEWVHHQFTTTNLRQHHSRRQKT